MSDSDTSLVPLEEAQIELMVANSRFICSLAPIFSVEEARSYILSKKKEYADASHNVPAFIIGHGASRVTHCSDDGEPSGSAGRPALSVLQGSGLGDVVVVITRYFGGTKLGIGGLVKAYGDAVREVLVKTKKARKVCSVVINIAYDYSFVDRIRILAADIGGRVDSEEFAEKVTMTVTIPLSKQDEFYKSLSELTRGSVITKEIEFGDLLIPINF